MSKGKRKVMPHPSHSYIKNVNGKMRADGKLGTPQIIRGRKLPVPYVSPLQPGAGGMGGGYLNGLGTPPGEGW